MTDKKYDVFGVGNAIVDILSMVEDSSVEELSLAKGSMTLMDTETQSGVLQHLEGRNLKMASGGSAANTMVGIAQSGGTGAYFGKVAHDTHGEYYKKDMQAAGIEFPVTMASEQALPTGTCVVLTTPDAERTMCTHLGISTTLSPDDIDEEMLAQSKIAYIEGYLWDAEQPRAACIKTFEACKKHGVQAASLFQMRFLIGRFADDFKSVVAEHCDILFCNADEGRMFFGVEDVEAVADNFKTICDLVFLTDGPNGCYVIQNGECTHVPGFGVNAIDTVGAGDAFAGGALFGLTNGMDAVSAAKWGNYLASRVVAQVGPRLEEESLSEHVGQVVAGVV